jgi:4a-hydroxytetrahydrobiopterin dehydratase
MATLSGQELQSRVEALGGWELGEQDGAACIVRDLELRDFAAALSLLDRVGELAEAANHHPDMLLHGWNKVRLTLSTHSAGGLTEADLELAGRIDGLL